MTRSVSCAKTLNMDSLIFSLNVVLPIFIIILLGAFLARIRILDPDVCQKLLKLVFYVSLPASLFQSVASSNLREAVNARFVLYAVASSLAVFFLAWGLSALFLKEKAQIGAAAHAAFRGNFAYVGLAVCQNLLGKESIPSTISIFAFTIPLYNVLAVLLLSHYDESGRKPGIGKEILNILQNPLILSVAAGMVFSLLGIPIVAPAAKSLSYMAQTASPLALLLIGANLDFSTLKADWKGITTATMVKIVLAPLLGTIGAVLLGFRGEELAVLYTMHAVPSAANSYIMTRQMHGDAGLGAGAVVATSLFSIFTMTVGIWWMRSLGLV